MPIPTRPINGGGIDTDWGQQVHDDTFSPKGCRLEGSGAVECGTTPEQLPLDTALNDPSGWLDAGSNSAVVPSDAEGIYAISCRCVSDESSAATRVLLYQNGVAIARAYEQGAGTSQIQLLLAPIRYLSAGDEFTVFGQRDGSGDDPEVFVAELTFVRLGREWS